MMESKNINKINNNRLLILLYNYGNSLVALDTFNYTEVGSLSLLTGKFKTLNCSDSYFTVNSDSKLIIVNISNFEFEVFSNFSGIINVRKYKINYFN